MPTVTVEVWSYLSLLFGAKDARRHTLEEAIEEGITLGTLLVSLAEKHPRFGEVMYKPDSREPSGRVSVVVNDRLPELLDGYETKLHDKDRVILIQAYAGG